METTVTGKKVVWVIILCVLGQILIQLLMVPILLLPMPELMSSLLMSILYICLTCFYVKWLVQKVLHMEPAFFRITGVRIKVLYGLVELLLGVAAPILLYVALVPGCREIYSLSTMRWCITLVKAFGCVGLGAALVEELLFRGIVLRLVELKLGTKWALLLPALFWAALHLITADYSNFTASLLRVFSVTYAGVVFSVITVVTGSVWNSVFFHMMWNFVTGGLIAIGPEANSHVMLNYIPNAGNMLLTGGENGIDGSIITIVCYTVVMVVHISCSRLSRSRFAIGVKT